MKHPKYVQVAIRNGKLVLKSKKRITLDKLPNSVKFLGVILEQGGKLMPLIKTTKLESV